MGGIFGAIAKQIAQSLREAQAAEQAAALEAQAAQQRAIAQAMARERTPRPQQAPPPQAQQRPSPQLRQPRPAAAAAQQRPPPAVVPRPQRPPAPDMPSLEDSFPTHLDSVSSPDRSRSQNPLLAAFGGGSGMLGALVLATALGPPSALHPHEPPH